MSKPRHHLVDGACDGARRHGRPIDQDHRHTQRPRGIQLRTCAHATGVLRHDMGDAVRLHQSEITRQREWSLGDDHSRPGQGQDDVGRIDQTQQVVMLRTECEGVDRLPTDRQKNPCRFIGQRGDRVRDVGNRTPVIAFRRLPRRSFECQQRNADSRTGFHSISTHPCGKRMGGVDDMSDCRFSKSGGQPLYSAEPADADRQGLTRWRRGAASIGKDSVDACFGQFTRHLAGFGGAAQQKDTRHG